MFLFNPPFWPFKNHWTGQKSCFLIRRVLKKPFFYLTSPQGVLFCQNKSQLSNLQNGHREMFLFNPPFWPFKNHWTCQKSCFLIRRVLKKPFFYLTSPQGVLFCQNKSQLSNLQNGHREMFLFNPPFWPFKNHWTGQKSCFLIRRVLKRGLVLPSFFYLTWTPQKGPFFLFCQNKSQLSNLQNGHREMFLFNPPFWPFKNHWTGQKSCFLIRRVLKKPFFYLTSPRGSCFAKIRVSCQTFKMVIERCFYLIPHFDHLKTTGQVRNHVFSSEEC